MDTMPKDPTAFQPAKAMATRDIQVGYELEPVTKKITLDKTRIQQGWPRFKNHHDDYPYAQRMGLKRPIIQFNQICESFGEMLIKFFGEGYLGGKLSLNAIRQTEPETVITVRGVVQEKIIEGDTIRLILDVWCENDQGKKVMIGTASGLVH